MSQKVWLIELIALFIMINSSIIMDLGVAIEGESLKTGTAIVAVNDFNSPGTTLNVGHVAVLFENPKDHTYKFVSVQARDQDEPITPNEIDGLTKEKAEDILKKGGYTRFKTYEVKDPKFENADAEIDNLRKEKFEIGTSTPGGLISRILLSAADLSWSKYDNCLTGGIKILEKYGAEMPSAGFWNPTTPKGYYEKLSGEKEEYTWSSTENKYVSTETGTPFKSSSEGTDLGGINFTSIKLNYISVSADQNSGINFDLGLKAQKAEGDSPGIDPINSTLIGATAFITGLAVPDGKFWVRLAPSDPDRIIDEELAQSDVGRIMLEADLQMKKDIHYYGNPCANKTGKALWDHLDMKREALAQRCMDRFPGEIENINNLWFVPVTRFNIVPDKVFAYTNGTQIYIINATLSIESAEMKDSFFKVTNQDTRALSKGCLEELNRSAKEYGEYAKELQFRMILPYVIADINHGEKYEDLREVYISLALAQWYKSRITPHMDIFRKSLDSSGPTMIASLKPWSPKEIWDRYIYSYRNGEYRCWENTTTKSSFHQAGGVSFDSIRDHMVEIEGMPPEVQDRVNRAITNGYVDEEADVLFGNRLHVATKEDTLTTAPNAESSQKTAKQNVEAEGDSSGSRTDKGISLPNELTSGQNNTASLKLAASGSTSKVTCPEGWMGPDEKGECWKLQITN